MRVRQQSHVVRAVEGNGVGAVCGEERADCSANHRKQGCFSECLADDPGASRTKRNPRGELVTLARHPREEDIRYARARR